MKKHQTLILGLLLFGLTWGTGSCSTHSKRLFIQQGSKGKRTVYHPCKAHVGPQGTHEENSRPKDPLYHCYRCDKALPCTEHGYPYPSESIKLWFTRLMWGIAGSIVLCGIGFIIGGLISAYIMLAGSLGLLIGGLVGIPLNAYQSLKKIVSNTDKDFIEDLEAWRKVNDWFLAHIPATVAPLVPPLLDQLAQLNTCSEMADLVNEFKDEHQQALLKKIKATAITKEVRFVQTLKSHLEEEQA